MNNTIVARFGIIGTQSTILSELPPDVKGKCFVERLIGGRKVFSAAKLLARNDLSIFGPVKHFSTESFVVLIKIGFIEKDSPKSIYASDTWLLLQHNV
jgi:hypothetical protein